MPIRESLPTTPSGKDFSATFEVRLDPQTGLRNAGVSDRRRDNLVREEQAKLVRQKWDHVTVYNLNRFALTVNLGELGVIEVPAAREGEEYSTYHIKNYRISMRDLGDGNFTPVSVLPSELASEIVREYRDNGGVFWSHGSGEPKPDELQAARERLAAWHNREYHKAVDAWSRYHQHKFITDRQRDAAQELLKSRAIAELPEWASLTRKDSSRRPCPECGEDIKRTARICHFCKERVEPAPSPESSPSSSD